MFAIVLVTMVYIVSRIVLRIKNFRKLVKNEKMGGLKESFLPKTEQNSNLMTISFDHTNENDVL